MKNAIVIFFFSFLFFSFNMKAQQKECVFRDNDMLFIYHTSRGRIDGKYTSYYKNGKIKAEGNFKNNYRYGEWTLWDTTGNMLIKRYYKNPFTFDNLVSEKQFKITPYVLKYNNDGYLDYFQLKEKMIITSKRVWRFIPSENNSLLFEKNILQKIITTNINKDSITAYDTKDDEFNTPLKHSEINSNFVKFIGYKIKEDWFFDNERMVSEMRIIGICPVAIDTFKHDTIDLYWLYFPKIRRYLAMEKINVVGVPPEITNYDDLFFYRYFYSNIYKEANFKNKEISDYKNGDDINKEAERIEINIIEMEHDTWKKLAGI